jgi:hypothetical protein
MQMRLRPDLDVQAQLGRAAPDDATIESAAMLSVAV